MTAQSIRGPFAIAALAAAVVLGACASAPAETSPPVYTERGPHEVGVLTLSLSDRKVEVYYPAAAGAAQGRTNDVYLQTEPVPPMLAGMLKRIPDTVDLKVAIPAFRDAPAASGAAYPLVMVSHGAGGWRSGHGNLLSGIASWGFVVASVDFNEYGFASFASPGARDMNARRRTLGGRRHDVRRDRQSPHRQHYRLGARAAAGARRNAQANHDHRRRDRLRHLGGVADIRL